MAALVTSVLSTAFSCAKGATTRLPVCMHNFVRACVKERPLATSARVHMSGFFLSFFFFVARQVLGHLWSHTHTRTHTHMKSTCCLLYGNRSCQLPDSLTPLCDWLIWGDVGVDESRLQFHWLSGSNKCIFTDSWETRGDLREIKVTGTICKNIWDFECCLSMKLSTPLPPVLRLN